MSKYSLVPEKQLIFSPGLAQTIGLEEAILVQHLKALFDFHTPLARKGYYWLSVRRSELINNLPFWTNTDLDRILLNLVERGVILIDEEANSNSQDIFFALNEGNPSAVLETNLRTSGALKATKMSISWFPSKDILSLIELNHNIPQSFSKEQLEDFTLYWHERGETNHAWDNKFRQHVISRWRKHKLTQDFTSQTKGEDKLDQTWQPNKDALEILMRAGIDETFINDALPEFILYWRERDPLTRGLNSKFIQHIRLQWSRFKNSLGNESESAPIRDSWRPSSDLFDILKLAHIDKEFAASVLPEFILYWQENGGVRKSWNSKFLQHVKYHWARRHQFNQGRNYENEQGTFTKSRTRDRSIEEDLQDTSWAD